MPDKLAVAVGVADITKRPSFTKTLPPGFKAA